MYHHHFHLNEEPFGVSPDPRFFYGTAQHLEAAASVYYAIAQRRGIAALIAPPGLGKTSVVVSLLDRLRSEADVVLIVHPELSGSALVESVLVGLGLEAAPDGPGRTRQLAAHLVDLDRRGRTCVVILDEAQNLSAAALESVRMLSNLEFPGRKLIQFILVGQPALMNLLSRPECEQVRQRVNVVARLQPLAFEEIGAYIRHRLAAAGAAREIFAPAAVHAIASGSGGVPRIINTICFNALTVAYAQGRTRVTEADVAEALADIAIAPVEGAPIEGAQVVRDAPAFTMPSRRPVGLAHAVFALLLLGAAIAVILNKGVAQL